MPISSDMLWIEVQEKDTKIISTYYVLGTCLKLAVFNLGPSRKLDRISIARWHPRC